MKGERELKEKHFQKRAEKKYIYSAGESINYHHGCSKGLETLKLRIHVTQNFLNLTTSVINKTSSQLSHTLLDNVVAEHFVNNFPVDLFPHHLFEIFLRCNV
jgi:hypothetical protein